MAAENESLPLKSLELPTKTVGKLKPLGLKTVGDLYACSVSALVEAGLVEREVVEIAEGAVDFGVAWLSPVDAKKAFAGITVAAKGATEEKRAAEEAPAKEKKPAAKKAAKGALPESFAVAFSSDRNVKTWSLADVEEFLAGKKNAADVFRLFRRMRVGLEPTIGGKDHWVLDALVDMSLVAEEAASRIQEFLLHALSTFEDEVTKAGVKRLASGLVGSNLQMTIAANGRPKALAIVEAHTARIAGGAVHAYEVPQVFVPIAVEGTLAGGETKEAAALAERLVPIDAATPESQRIWRVRLVADAFRRAGKSKDGVKKLGAAIEKAGLAKLTAPGAEQTLTAIARLAADAGEPEKAVDALRALFAMEAKRPGVVSLRAEVIDDPVLTSLRTHAAFQALFKGFPVFEAKLR